jgi:hypothetical protein
LSRKVIIEVALCSDPADGPITSLPDGDMARDRIEHVGPRAFGYDLDFHSVFA